MSSGRSKERRKGWIFYSHAIQSGGSQAFISTFENINMDGNGLISAFGDFLSIQNEDLEDRTVPLINKGNYLFKSSDYIRTGLNVNSSFVNGNYISQSNVELVAKNYISLENGTQLSGKSNFVHIDSAIPPIVTTPYSKGQSQTKPNIVTLVEPVAINSQTNKIEEIEKVSFFSVPIQDILNYKIDNDINISSFEIFDLSGKIIHHQKIAGKSGIIDFTKFPQVMTEISCLLISFQSRLKQISLIF